MHRFLVPIKKPSGSSSSDHGVAAVASQTPTSPAPASETRLTPSTSVPQNLYNINVIKNIYPSTTTTTPQPPPQNNNCPYRISVRPPIHSWQEPGLSSRNWHLPTLPKAPKVGLWSILICWEWIGGFLLNMSQNNHISKKQRLKLLQNNYFI